MTPGLAFFYGGMCRSKSVLNMLMMSFSALGIVSVLWVLYGYAIAFGSSHSGLFGWSSGYVGLKDLVHNVTIDAPDGVVNTFGLPDLAFSAFQVMFVTSSGGRRLGSGLRWQSRHQLMLSGWSCFTSTIWSTRPWQLTQPMPRTTCAL